MKNSNGQAAVLVILAIPIFAILMGIVGRIGHKTLLVHQTQAYCESKVLGALAWQGEGLRELSKINDFLEPVILARWAVIAAMIAAASNPVTAGAVPMLDRIRAILVKIQKGLGMWQKATHIKYNMKAFQVLRKLKKPVLLRNAKNMGELYLQFIPMGPHGMPTSLILHVEKKSLYQREDYAPLKLDDDFKDKQHVMGRVSVDLSSTQYKFPFANFGVKNSDREANSMSVLCDAKLDMNQISDRAPAQLTKPKLQFLNQLLENR